MSTGATMRGVGFGRSLHQCSGPLRGGPRCEIVQGSASVVIERCGEFRVRLAPVCVVPLARAGDMNVRRSLVRAEALGRVDTLVAVMSMTERPTDDDIAWAQTAGVSLAGLCARLGVSGAAVSTQLAVMRGQHDDARASSRDHLIGMLDQIRAQLSGLATPSVPAQVDVGEIAESAREETARLAEAHAIALVAEVVTRPGSAVSRSVAGGVIDAVGLVLAHMATTGCVHGGSIRVEVRRDGEVLAVTLGDRGNAESRAVVPSSGPTLHLAAAANRLVTLGGEFTVSGAPWGGTSVVITIRDRTGLGEANLRRRG